MKRKVMSSKMSGGDVQAKRTRSLNVAGVCLVAVSFLIPFLPLPGHGRLQMEPVVAMVGVFLTLLMTQGLMWLMARHKPEETKARGRFLVGLALLVMVASNFAQAAQSKGSGDEAFNKQVKALQDKYGAAFESMGMRFRAADISLALTPNGVTTREGLTNGMTLVATYRGLLDERKRLLADQHADIDKLFKMKSVSPNVRRAAEIIFTDDRARLEKMNVDLDHAQREMADAMSNLLAWFEKELGRVGVRDGRVIYFLPEQKAAVDPLFEKLQNAEARQKWVLQAAAKEQALAEATDAPRPATSAASAPSQGKKKPKAVEAAS